MEISNKEDDILYLKTMIDVVLKYTSKGVYIIEKKVRNNVFFVRDQEKGIRYVLKIILDANHILRRFDVLRGSERSARFHHLLASYDMAPKVIEHIKIDGGSILILEYIPEVLDRKALYVPRRAKTSSLRLDANEDGPVICKAIDDLIEKLHNLGIVHGDLHSRNIRYKKVKNGAKVYMIDLDTMFFMKEYEICSFPQRWIEHGFDDISTLDEFLLRERDNYKNLIDDDE
jgi:tRNA A-37 threonylcarbamoyl transferase component Bud32